MGASYKYVYTLAGLRRGEILCIRRPSGRGVVAARTGRLRKPALGKLGLLLLQEILLRNFDVVQPVPNRAKSAGKRHMPGKVCG